MKLLWSKVKGLFCEIPILVRDGWSLSITLNTWRIEKRVDSIGRYLRIGPILFEYDYTHGVN